MKGFKNFELTQGEQRNAIGKGKPEFTGRPEGKGQTPWEKDGLDKDAWKALRTDEDETEDHDDDVEEIEKV